VAVAVVDDDDDDDDDDDVGAVVDVPLLLLVDDNTAADVVDVVDGAAAFICGAFGGDVDKPVCTQEYARTE
jgi:hypothetical protein